MMLAGWKMVLTPVVLSTHRVWFQEFTHVSLWTFSATGLCWLSCQKGVCTVMILWPLVCIWKQWSTAHFGNCWNCNFYQFLLQLSGCCFFGFSLFLWHPVLSISACSSSVVCGFAFQRSSSSVPHRYLQSEVWTSRRPTSSESLSGQCAPILRPLLSVMSVLFLALS